MEGHLSSSSASEYSYTLREERESNVWVRLPRRVLLVPADVEAADRFLLSNSQVTTVVAAVLRSADPPADVNKFTISRESVRRARVLHRTEVSAAARASFIPPEHAVVHWDGKTISDSLGSAHHRQAILISGKDQEKLLAISLVSDSTGLTQATATSDALEDWGCEDNVIGLCFDTTSSNTGRIQGAVVRLERMLGRPLLQLSCRHHVFELLVGAVARALFGRTTAPLFEQLRKRWNGLDLTVYDTLEIKDSGTWLLELRDSAVREIGAVSTFLRDDYRELAELTLLILGVQPQRGTQFLRPGAYHHARWMSKVIYYTKMHKFSRQLKWDEELVRKIRQVVQFISLLYALAWLAAPHAADAAANDMQLYQCLLKYRGVEEEVANASLAVIQRHLWYLRLQTVISALFSDRVEDAVKQEMVEKLSRYSSPEDFENENISIDEETRLPDLVDESSWLIFSRLKLAHAVWLSRPVESWSEDDQYCKDKETIDGLRVTNDVVERGVKLIQDFDFANSMTTSAAQLVVQHRKNLQKVQKRALGKL